MDDVRSALLYRKHDSCWLKLAHVQAPPHSAATAQSMPTFSACQIGQPTGHSLGGALAAYLGWLIGARYPEVPINVVNFAPISYGDAAFTNVRRPRAGGP